MKKPLQNRLTTVVLFVLLWLLIMPFTAKSQTAPAADCEDLIEADLPYSENFDNVATDFPDCWTRTSDKIFVGNDYPSGKMMFFNPVEGQIIATTPKFDLDVSKLEIQLKLQFDNLSSGGVTVGVMTDPTDVSSFEVVKVVTGTSMYNWEDFIVSFSEYSGNGKYIAFRVNQSNNRSYLGALTVRMVGFSTGCTPISKLPFVENFDNTLGGSSSNSVLPACWSINVSGNTKPYVQRNSSSNFVSSPGALNFHTTSNNNTNIAILPEFDLSTLGLALKDLQVSFSAKRTDTAGIFILGVMSNPTDTNTFIHIDTILLTRDYQWRQFTMPLTAYQGSGKYIAFMWKNGRSSATAYIDNLYVDKISTCPQPTDVTISDIKSNQVAYSFIDNISNSWEMLCVPAGTIPDWSEAYPIVDNEGKITGLLDNTKYELYIRVTCASGEGVPTYNTFKTACKVLTEEFLPFKEDFETVYFADCWTNTASSGSIYVSNSYTATVMTLYFTSSAGQNTVSTPEWDIDISKLQVEFKARIGNTTSSISVGVMTDPTDFSTFESVGTVTATRANEFESKTVSLANYNGEGKYIAFRFTSSAVMAAIDDIVISKIPTCFAPTNLTVSDLSNDEATITWSENSNATTWDIAYGPRGFNPDNAGEAIKTISFVTNPATITELTESTSYDVYVRSDCGDEMSAWSAALFLRTTQIPAELPYRCDFEGDEENAAWILSNGTQTNKWHIGELATTPKGSKSLYISDNDTAHSYSNTASYVYAMRTLDLSTAGVYELSFDWRSNGENNADLMRVFLLPSTISPAAGAFYNMNGYNNAEPGDWMDIGGGMLQLNDTWAHKDIQFTIDNPSIYNLVIFWKNNNLTLNQSPGAIDNIAIERLTCFVPSNIAITHVDNTEATIAWNKGDATDWEVLYGEQGFAIGSKNPVALNDTTYTMTNLTPNFTSYEVYVRTICEDDNSRWEGPIFFNTSQLPAPLPYTCNFEDDTENGNWGLLNGTQTNQWAVGSAESSDIEGSFLYISNSDGETHEYTKGAVSYVYAARTLDFSDSGVYEVDFDWRGYTSPTSSTQDLVNAFLVPVKRPMEPGNAYGMTSGTNTAPAGWINLRNGTTSENGIWQHVHSTVTVSNPGMYNLVFFWKNSSNTNEQQNPGAVDNISVKRQYCTAVNGLNISNVTSTSSTLTWIAPDTQTEWEIQYGYSGFTLGSGGMTEFATGTPTHNFKGLIKNSTYDVYVRPICGDDIVGAWSSRISFTTLCETGLDELPYIENFDNNGGLIPSCWIVRKSENARAVPYLDNGPAVHQSAPYGLIFANAPNNGFSMAILPMIDASIAVTDLYLEFYSRAGIANDGTFYVGVMEDPLVDSTFTIIATYVKPSNNWGRFTLDFEDYTGNGKYIAFKWQNGANIFALDNMQLTSKNSVICATPSAVTTSNITHQSATITWEAGENTSWSVEYKKVSESIYSTPDITNTANYSLTDLEEKTNYDVRIRTICNDNSISKGFFTRFTTLIAPITYTITPSAGENGTISPSEIVTVNEGSDQTFTFTPNARFLVDSVTVDGVAVEIDSATSTYTIVDIRANKTIHVAFKEDLAVPQYQLDNSVLVYPNPVSDQLKVKLSAAFEQIEITNLLGQVVYTTNVNNQEFSIDMGNYHAGIYFIRLSGKQGVATKKFIKE